METVPIDPARLEWCHWDERNQRREGGDIAEAYSADRIRKPFIWQGNLMVTVSGGGPGPVWEAYRLVPLKSFPGTPTTYAAKVCGQGDHGEAARNDPLGFYHGMTVKSGGQSFIMVGPEVRFTPDKALAERKADQLSLF